MRIRRRRRGRSRSLTGMQMAVMMARVMTVFLLQYFGSAYQPPAGLQTADTGCASI